MINLFQPNIDIDDAVARYQKTLESGWLGRGDVVKEFEGELARFISVDPDLVHCVSSCTSAIFEICMSLELDENDTVVIPTNSFPSVPAAIMTAGANLEVVDVDVRTGNISLQHLEEVCNQKVPKAIFVTDYGGTPVSIRLLKEIVGPDCLILVDAAASLGTRYRESNEFIHSLADFVCYSFDAMKLITCGEGGAAVIKDEQIRERFKEFSYLGLPSKTKSGLDVANAGSVAGWWEYDLKCLGRRSVMSDLSAGLGLSQMVSIEQKLATRQELKVEYQTLIGQIPRVSFLCDDRQDIELSNYFFTIITDCRDALARHLLDNKVYTSFRYWPIHKMEIFKSGCVGKLFPAADYLAQNALNLPIHDALNRNDVARICDLIKAYLK